jgi:WD40 repeat protein
MTLCENRKRPPPTKNLLHSVFFENRFFTPLKTVVSQDDRLAAAICSDSVIRVWNLTQWNESPITISDLAAVDVSFSPSSLMLFIRSNNQRNVAVDLDLEILAKQLCEKVRRGLTAEEWSLYVAEDLPIERPCVFNK